MNNQAKGEVIVTCVKSICGLATYAVGVWGLITVFCGNPFRRKVVVVQQQVPAETETEEEES